MRILSVSSFFVLLNIMTACNSEGSQTGRSAVFSESSDFSDAAACDLSEIQNNGELIVLTMYGPHSFFEQRGECFGEQYMVVKEYAGSVGVKVRMEVCRSEQEMKDKLVNSEGDVIAYAIHADDSVADDIVYCGKRQLTALFDSLSLIRHDATIRTNGDVAWAVRRSSSALAESLTKWLAKNQDRLIDYTFSSKKGKRGRDRTRTRRRRVYSPVLNASRGQISVYDNLFKTYSKSCAWDWRLLAAQAYQESGFDSYAVSWMGAQGLMQLMPSTAKDMGLKDNEVFKPEDNLRAAVTFIRQLNGHYADVPNVDDRLCFVLAAYNAGPGHIDDARALCKKKGLDPNVWRYNVEDVVSHMGEVRYYNDPVVQHGYFRGEETYDYVTSIRTRWNEYKRLMK